MIKLAVALPAYGLKLDVGHAAMWLGFGAALANTTDKFTLVSFTEYHINGIDLARNTAVWDALVAGADWLLMIDNDTFHRSSAEAIGDAGMDLLQMIRDADRMQVYIDPQTGMLTPLVWPAADRCPINNLHWTGVGLVGAPVRGRGVGDSGVCVQELRSAHDAQGGEFSFWAGEQVPLDILAGKMSVVGRIGGACIGINLDWIRRSWPKGPWFAMQHDYTERPKNARGEDYFICDGIYQRGGLVLADGRFVPEHVDRRRLVGEVG